MISIRRATEIERQQVIYRHQIEKLVWEDIHPQKTRIFVALEETDERQKIVGFVRYEPGGVHALLGSLFVEPDHRGSGIAAQLVQHVEAQAQMDQRKNIVLFSKFYGGFYEKLGYNKIVLGEGMRLIKDTPQGRWFDENRERLTREICYSKVLLI